LTTRQHTSPSTVFRPDATQRSIRALIAASRLPRLESRMLLEHVLAKPRAWLLAHDDEPLDDAVVATFLALATRRALGEPMAYLLGEREFMGHMFTVTPDVLIPRPDTELLVEIAVESLIRLPEPDVVDLGTGSGAIAVSLALACPHARVAASDLSPAALAVARGNAMRLGATVTWHQGDWYAALPEARRYDLILSNPPYVACRDAHLSQGDLRYEPRSALTDGADGLRALRVLAEGCVARLKPGGAICLKHGWDQAAAVRGMLSAAGLCEVYSRRDLAGIERVTGGRLA